MKVCAYYDSDEAFSEVLNALIPNFEYPDHSHKTVQQILMHYGHLRRSGGVTL